MSVYTCSKDIENAFFTLLWQFLEKLHPVLPMPSEASQAFQRCASDRAEVIKELGVCKAKGKKILLEVANIGCPPSTLAQHHVIAGLRKASIWLKWLAISNLPDLYNHCCNDKSKPVPENSMIAYLYQAVEDFILCSWVQYLFTLDLQHLSLHFDGCRVQAHSLDVAAVCQSSSEWIAKETGFQVVIKQKKHFLFLELLKSEGKILETMSLPSSFRISANGILACLAFVADRWNSVAEWLERHPADVAGDQKHRSYKECLEAVDATLAASVGCNLEKTGKYLLHAEHDGSPVVLGCVVTEDACKVLAGRVVYEISTGSLLSCFEDSIDSSSMVTFRLQMEGDAPGQEAADVLLELQAGSDVLGGADLLCECEGLADGSDDEGMPGEHFDEAIVRVGDDLLKLLAEERSEALNGDKTVRQGKSYRCPLCLRKFARPRRVKDHVQKYHAAQRQFCCSGTKQIRVIHALFDEDQLRNLQPRPTYLRRSASLLRASVGEEDGSVNSLDRNLRLVMTNKGPSYKSLQCISQNASLYRRAKNLYYTHGFADLLFQEMLVSNAKMKQVAWLWL